MAHRRTSKRSKARAMLLFADLEQSKNAVLHALGAASSQASYGHAIVEFIGWYCSEPRLAFNRTVVLRYRFFLEQKNCFFIISHDRRQIVHFNVTQHPTTSWIVQQLREAFPYESAPKFLLFDHDQKYVLEVPAALRSLQFTGVQTSIRSPWQNGVAERWVGSCRRDVLDHIIALNARHLKRLLSAYASYYHDDRTHLGLHKETPGRRIRSGDTGPVICHARLGGLHHRYDRAA
jgi:hypothetical protein